KRVYGRDSLSGSYTLSFGQNIEVQNLYPLAGSGYNIDTGTHNIPSSLGSGASAYDFYYKDYATNSMSITGFSGSGNNVNFSYNASLSTAVPLEVVSHGTLGYDNDIYKLFGGKNNIVDPRVKDAIEKALEAGRNGTAAGNKLYLVFMPTVIEYKQYITVEDGELIADLDLPTSAKQEESFTVADASIVADSLTIASAHIRYRVDKGEWQDLITWPGTGKSGENTGKNISQSFPDICTIDYEITAETTSGQSATKIKTINIVDKRDLEGQATLLLPETTYEGYTVEARDISMFDVDGVFYSATRAYEEKLASNKFVPSSAANATMKKTSSTSADITFPKRGTYPVRLEVSLKGGAKLTDTKEIEVLKTPDIIASLGGTQKQNRKQVLNARIHTHPERPLTILYAELQTENGSQKVRLEHLIGNEQNNEKQNSDEIKTRPIELVSSSPYFTEISLPFLTKNQEEKEYSYYIYARDSEGNYTEVSSQFTVKSDLPPEPIITLANEHIREEGSNFANIEVSDTGTTDGDEPERQWLVSVDAGNTWKKAQDMNGFEELSFGKMKTFEHKKEGVGKVLYKLSVKDRWTEETLEEYISPEDYLSAETYGETDVINIAPKVSLYPLSSKKVELLMIARTPQEEAVFKAAANNSEIQLIEEGIDADITVRSLNPIKTALAGITEPKKINTFTTSTFGWEGQDTMLEKDWYIADSQRFYTIEGSWNTTKTQAPYLDSPAQPAYLTAYDLRSGSQLWRKQVRTRDLDISGFSTDCILAQDDMGEFLLLANKTRTLIYDKLTGELLCNLGIAVGHDNYLRNKKIYTVRSDGIYSINIRNGQIKKTFSAEICVSNGYCDKTGYSRICNKKICFVTKKGSTLKKVALDPVTEQITSQELIPDMRLMAPCSVIGFDSEGKLALEQNGQFAEMIFVFDGDGNFLKGIYEDKNERGRDAVCSFDGSGRFEYIVTANNAYSKGSKTRSYYIRAKAYPISGANPLEFYDRRQVSKYATSGNGTDANRTVYAITLGNKVVLCSGDRATSISDGSEYSNYNWSIATQIVFDFGRNTTSRGQGGGPYDDLQIGGRISEYGKRSDDYCLSAYSWGHAGYRYDTPVNGQGAKVSVLPETVDSMIGRTIFANMTSKDERSNEKKAALFLTNASGMGGRSLTAIEKAGTALLIGEWHSGDIEATIYDYFINATKDIEKEDPPMVYKKGEAVSYGITYSDYENDPSKRQYWRYIHTPFNDGLHPDAGKILSEPIRKFYVDGKYTAEHWQEDSTGKVNYDKLSNVAKVTFYIEGLGNAPWIEYINTMPAKVKARAPFDIRVAVDDLEKDELQLETSLYKKGKLICENMLTGINADWAGNYPLLTALKVQGAEQGTYDVVCVVRDLTGAGIGEYRFQIEIVADIKGEVSHTDKWEGKRQTHNGRYPQNTRPANYFWAGESFVLNAIVEGGATKVTARIKGFERFRTTLVRKGTAGLGADKEAYGGVIWDREMASLWKDARGLPLTFEFIAQYEDGTEESHNVTVILDNTGGDFKLHRVR
ncbi:MAG: hypothetical protein PHX63_05795, partial [Eubacteriales bacterium]|nr:hypothetical protein [Eubacteriales bacterium]